mgnify:FL=1
MQLLTYLIPVLISVLITGCSEPPPAEPVAASKPVKSMLVKAGAAEGTRHFPAHIDAGSKAELSFRVPGTVLEFPVKEGEKVKAGQTVAILDKKDYQLVVNDFQAKYDNAKKNFDRAKGLIKDGYISKMDYDRLESEFKSARSELDTARQDLIYTTLKAPFDGVIAKKYIEAFQEVQAKQVILDLHDVSTLEVKFDVPENLVIGIRSNKNSDDENKQRVPVTVSFENLPGQSFELTFKQASTKADPKTQTYEVTFTMPQLANHSILAGMTATATADLSTFLSDNSAFTVPSSAIVGDYKLDPKAWVVDEKNMVVKSRPVKVGRLFNDKIEILEGLKAGERIVTAGTPFLVEDMKVTLLDQPEQAQPRPDDQK